MDAARLLIAGLAMASVPAAAQQTAAADITRIMPGRYGVDPQRSHVAFTINQLGFAAYRGSFVKVTGSLVIDHRQPARTRVVIDIPIRNLTTTLKQVDAHLRGPDFFDAVRFPVAHFESTSVIPMGRKARIAGRLTLKGVTKTVILDANLVGTGLIAGHRAVSFEATTTIRRSSFGVSAALPLIPDMIPLDIIVVFEKPQGKR